ncbi:MAG TPA: methyltransferase domain-containing protein [Draconibacterium sp.]|nr:methyltransferase domain-containing protein [Draconibacterium sp.]
MKLTNANFLCCPECKANLSVTQKYKNNGVNEEFLVCNGCRKEYLNNEYYIDFMGGRTLAYKGEWEKFIRSFYAKIYTPATNFMFLFCGGVKSAKKDVLSHLDLKDNSVVLETGIGAAENFYYLNREAKNLSFFGIDIQKQMLIHSVRNLKKWNISAELFLANAEELPFKDEMFDVVFHLGSINLFQNKERAINEMIRVAKPGSKLVIADESEKGGKLMNFFTGSNDVVVPPLNIIPKEMLNVSIETIWKGYGYVIEFWKPMKK